MPTPDNPAPSRDAAKKFDATQKTGSTPLAIMENMESGTEILVADDEPAVALAIKSALKFCGYNAVTVTGGEAAITRVTAEPRRFAAVMTDHNMPGLGGIALVKALRAINFPGPIVILSAYLTSENEAQYQALGVEQILSKPFNIERLRRALDDALHPAGC